MSGRVGGERASVNPARHSHFSPLPAIDEFRHSLQFGGLSIHTQLAVIGGGPAGLRAAEVAAVAGLQVTLYDGKPSVGRKFLVAGKGGLNLTHGESLDRFTTRYHGPEAPAEVWEKLIAGFDPTALRAWAAGLGVETFQATSGRVYPTALKAAPLLRRWIERLRGLGVRFEMNHRLSSFTPGPRHQLGFTNAAAATADAVILALGGGSWPQTGSDGSWTSLFETLGISHQPLTPANCGWEHPWPAETLAAAEGLPLKNLQVTAAHQTVTGELMLTRYGLEGGAIYQLGATLRAMPQPAVILDLSPPSAICSSSGKWNLSVRISSLKRSSAGNSAHPPAPSSRGVLTQTSNPSPMRQKIASLPSPRLAPSQKPFPRQVVCVGTRSILPSCSRKYPVFSSPAR